MEALVVPPDKPTRVEFVRDRPEPTAPPGEVKIRVHLAGICATDLEIARGYMRFVGVPGHEFVGTVVDGPAELTGQRVVAEINCPCGQCDLCRRGLSNHCPNRTTLGIAGRDGAFAEYLTIPAANCRVVPDAISDEQAVFVEPLAAAAHVLDAAPIDADTRVAVLGAGRLGFLTAQVIAHQPCQLDVIDPNPRVRALCEGRGLRAREPGQVPPGSQYDVVVESTGVPEGLRLALRLCRPAGTIVLKSTYADPEPIDLAPIVVNEVRVVGNRCGRFDRALELLRDHAVEVESLISGVHPLSVGVEAFAAAARPENVKILLRPGGA